MRDLSQESDRTKFQFTEEDSVLLPGRHISPIDDKTDLGREGAKEVIVRLKMFTERPRKIDNRNAVGEEEVSTNH